MVRKGTVMAKEKGWRDTGKGYKVRKIKGKPKAKARTTSKGLTGQAKKAAKNITKSANRAKKY